MYLLKTKVREIKHIAQWRSKIMPKNAYGFFLSIQHEQDNTTILRMVNFLIK